MDKTPYHYDTVISIKPIIKPTIGKRQIHIIVIETTIIRRNIQMLMERVLSMSRSLHEEAVSVWLSEIFLLSFNFLLAMLPRLSSLVRLSIPDRMLSSTAIPPLCGHTCSSAMVHPLLYFFLMLSPD